MKLKIVHILTEPDVKREYESIKSISPLGAYDGFEYLPQINQRYVGDAWKEIPAITQSEYTNHGPGHYGAFKSFKKAIENNFTDDIDGLILCECDCILQSTHAEFVLKVEEGLDFIAANNIAYLSFGSMFVDGVRQSPVIGLDQNHPDFIITNKIILAHCILIPKRSRELVLGALAAFSWDSPDIWFNEAFWRMNENNFGIIKTPLAIQHEGFSLIDNIWKSSM